MNSKIQLWNKCLGIICWVETLGTLSFLQWVASFTNVSVHHMSPLHSCLCRLSQTKSEKSQPFMGHSKSEANIW